MVHYAVNRPVGAVRGEKKAPVEDCERPTATHAIPLGPPTRVRKRPVDWTREDVAAALKEANGVVSKAAEILGISLKTLHNKLKEYGRPQDAVLASEE